MAGILLGLCLFIAYTFQTIGLHYTSSSKAGFITGLSVILVPILSIFILNIKITRNAVIGVFVATLGLYLLTAQDISAFNKGDGFVFICALGFAFHIILTNLFAQAHSAIILTIIQVTTVGLLSIFQVLSMRDGLTIVNYYSGKRLYSPYSLQVFLLQGWPF